MAASLRIHRTESQVMRGVGALASSLAGSVLEPEAGSVPDALQADYTTAQGEAIKRIYNKLNGDDFEGEHRLDVESQVQKLIEQATSHVNLSKSFKGWCPFW